MKFFDKKKHNGLDFWNVSSFMFLDYQKTFLRAFLIFLFTKECPILTALNSRLFEMKLGSQMVFCRFFPHKQSASKNNYTFSLKHPKYPFCAPIFHPISETESNIISFPKTNVKIVHFSYRKNLSKPLARQSLYSILRVNPHLITS